MHIIPVIDLLDGQVVHAKHGDRQHYAPIQSSLCNSSAPLDIIAALLQLYPFDRLYIADINAIQHRGNHFVQLSDIKHRYPGLEIWLDAGFDHAEPLQQAISLGVEPILGSESLGTVWAYHELASVCVSGHILSLDFKTLDFKTNGTDITFHGPAALYTNPNYWPDKIIAMTLDKVGSDAGPDFMRLQAILNAQIANAQSHNPKSATASRQVIAAGGVRHLADLEQLKHMGIAGVLVATALHKGMLTSSILNHIQTQMPD